MTPVNSCSWQFDMILVNQSHYIIQMPSKHNIELVAYKNRLSGL